MSLALTSIRQKFSQKMPTTLLCRQGLLHSRLVRNLSTKESQVGVQNQKNNKYEKRKDAFKLCLGALTLYLGASTTGCFLAALHDSVKSKAVKGKDKILFPLKKAIKLGPTLIPCAVYDLVNEKLLNKNSPTDKAEDIGQASQPSSKPSVNLTNSELSSGKQVKLAQLKNGSHIVEFVLVETMRELKKMQEQDPFAFYDLVMKCRDNSHTIIPSPFGDAKITLKRYGFMSDDGTIREDIKNIVLSSVVGDELEMKLESPIKRI